MTVLLQNVSIVGRSTLVGPVLSDLWPLGGLYPFLDASTALEVLSDNAADTLAGTGARTMLVTGLDQTGAPLKTSANLNGVTPVALGAFLRINQIQVISSGSVGGNVGQIVVRTVGGHVPQAVIAPLDSISQQFIFSVPKGRFISLGSFVFSQLSPGGDPGIGNLVRLILQARPTGTGTWQRVFDFQVNDYASATQIRPDPLLPAYLSGTDIRLSGVCQAAIVECACLSTGVLVQNG